MKRNIDQVILSLVKQNFIVKALTGCCDILARKDNRILVMKVLEDANAITPEAAAELVKTASAIHAAPLIISEKATGKLRDNVVYVRYGIPTINLATFYASLNNMPLFMMSKQSGIMAQLQGSKMKECREKEDISSNKLSRHLGISKRMLVRYEQEGAEISVQRALKLYDVLGDQVFRKVEIFSIAPEQQQSLSSDISLKYQDLGFMVTETKKVPFDVVAQKEQNLILTRVGDHINHDLNNISRAIGANDLAIVTKKKQREIPSLTKEEFLEFQKAAELIKFIQEY